MINLEHEKEGFEQAKVSKEDYWVAGLDEVGRGPLAGPVIACAVMINPFTIDQSLLEGINDSKKISAKSRNLLSLKLQDKIAFCFGAASVHEIDQINILQASLLAMRRALYGLVLQKGYLIPNYVILDGNQKLGIKLPSKPIIKGDGQSFTIAAASILAKQLRDHLMVKLDKRYPDYGFARNAGYGVVLHKQQLDALGPTPHHRLSFAPVRLAAQMHKRS